MSRETAMIKMIEDGLQTPVLAAVLDKTDLQETVSRLYALGEDGWFQKGCSSGEITKIKVLIDLWNGGGGATLMEVWRRLDKTNRALVFACMVEFEQRRDPVYPMNRGQL